MPKMSSQRQASTVYRQTVWITKIMNWRVSPPRDSIEVFRNSRPRVDQESTEAAHPESNELSVDLTPDFMFPQARL